MKNQMKNKNGKWMRSDEIAKHLNISLRGANKQLKKLRERGNVVFAPVRENGHRHYEYCLPTGWESTIWGRDAREIDITREKITECALAGTLAACRDWIMLLDARSWETSAKVGRISQLVKLLAVVVIISLLVASAVIVLPMFA